MTRMGDLPLPVNLVESTNRDPDLGRREWLSRLPETVRALADRWSLRLGEPYQPGGVCSWVAPVQDGTGRDLVLKVGWRHYESDDEAAGLRVWGGRGTVLLYDSHRTDTTGALLLERCRPGTTLAAAAPEPEQDAVVADLLRQLWSAPTDGYPFRPLQQMCDAWADEFEEKLAAAPDAVDPGLARTGMALFRSLPATADREAVLCTDLHAQNILAATREPWLVIDPKPYVGDPTYDVLQHFLNCPERLVADPTGLIRRMADLAGLDVDRLTAWTFARCVQEGVDQPALREVAHALRP
jgi:streptomycin 6-kinase